MASPVYGPGQQKPRPAPHIKRRGVIYCILTRPVDSHGMPIPGAAPEVGYIGKSRQTAWQREQQHRANQPFSDLIVGGSFVLEEGQWDDATLDAREQWWIRNGASVVPDGPRQRPRYNYEFNTDYEGRIEVWRAREHRQAREPGWQPAQPGIPRQRVAPGVRTTVRQPARSRSRSRLDRWWRRRRAAVALWSSAWLFMFAGTWWAGADSWQGWDEPRNAAVVASLTVAGIAWRRHKMSRPRRRRRRVRR